MRQMVAAMILSFCMGAGTYEIIRLSAAWAAHSDLCIVLYPGIEDGFLVDLLAEGRCVEDMNIVHLAKYRRLLAGRCVDDVCPD